MSVSSTSEAVEGNSAHRASHTQTLSTSSQSSSSSSTVSGGTARRQYDGLPTGSSRRRSSNGATQIVFTTSSDIAAQSSPQQSSATTAAAALSSSTTPSSSSSSWRSTVSLPVAFPPTAANSFASTSRMRRRIKAKRTVHYANSYPVSHLLNLASFGIAAGRPDPRSPNTSKVTFHVATRPPWPTVHVPDEVRVAVWQDLHRMGSRIRAVQTLPPAPSDFLPPPPTYAVPSPRAQVSQQRFIDPAMTHPNGVSNGHAMSPLHHVDQQQQTQQITLGAPKTWADMAARKHFTAAGLHNLQHSSSLPHAVAPQSGSLTGTSSATQSVIASPNVEPAHAHSSNSSFSTANTSTTSLPLNASLASAFIPQYKEPEHSYAKMSRTTNLAPILADSHLRHEAPLTVPRGLVNTGNLCFANSILQVLVYCAPFYNLFDLLGTIMPADFGNLTPLIEAVIQFLREFKVVPSPLHTDYARGLEALSDDCIQSEPFIPEFVYDAMRLNKRFDTMRRGHQEDAEEFLGFFLDTLHEELLSALRRSQPRVANASTTGYIKANGIATHDSNAENAADQGEGDEDLFARDVERPVSPTNKEDVWMEVGQKGKTSFTRTTSTTESPITHIFGGKLRSVLRVPGAKGSVTLEPYQALQLDIAASQVQTVEDAIRNIATPETVHGVRPSPTAASTVDATKQVYIESMPQILVLHLKRFGYDEVGGTIKNSKEVKYSATLAFADEVLSPTVRAEKKNYNLFGVVYHHGRHATGGHYTVDVLRQDASTWLHIDDTSYYPVPAEQVHYGAARSSGKDATSSPATRSMQRTHDGHAYLLFYEREVDVPASAAPIIRSAASFANNALRPPSQQRHGQGGLGMPFSPVASASYGVTPFSAAAFDERGGFTSPSGGAGTAVSPTRSSPRASGGKSAGGEIKRGSGGGAGGFHGKAGSNGWKAAPTHKPKGGSISSNGPGGGNGGVQQSHSSKRSGASSIGSAPASPASGAPIVKPPVPGAPPPSPAQLKAQKKYAAAMANKEREEKERGKSNFSQQ